MKDTIQQIRDRHNRIEAMEPSVIVDYKEMLKACHRDRADLLAEIDRLRAGFDGMVERLKERTRERDRLQVLLHRGEA